METRHEHHGTLPLLVAHFQPLTSAGAVSVRTRPLALVTVTPRTRDPPLAASGRVRSRVTGPPKRGAHTVPHIARLAVANIKEEEGPEQAPKPTPTLALSLSIRRPTALSVLIILVPPPAWWAPRRLRPPAERRVAARPSLWSL